MSAKGESSSKIQDLGELDSDEECTEDFEILDGLCVMCQQFRTFKDAPNVYREHHTSFRNLLWAARLGCRLCRFVLDQHPHGYASNEPENVMNDAISFRQTNYSNSLMDFYTAERFRVRFEFAVDKDDPLAGNEKIPSRSISTHTTPELCRSFAIHYMKQCTEAHDCCASISAGSMPTRVLDVSTSGNTLPRVITTNGLTEPWISLSYCWGSDGQMVTATTDSIHKLMEGLELASLPKTFQDAILVTRTIGFRYLWIDALCIIQDDPADLYHELGNMCNIYKGSALTIAIDGASSVSEGFLGERIPVKNVTVPGYSNELNLDGTLELRRSLALSRYAYDVLRLRGWSLQETVLSPRTLHIGRKQLFWSCQSLYCSEGTPEPDSPNFILNEGALKRSFSQSGTDPQKDTDVQTSRTDYHLEGWYKIVNDYHSRSLSFATDTFPAIAGLAEEIHRQTSLTYKAGIWEQDVHRGLLWYASQEGIQPPSYQAPSWSWASLDLRKSTYAYLGISMESEFNTLTSALELANFHLEGISRPFIDTPGKNSFLQLRGSWVAASLGGWLDRPPPFCNQKGRQFGLYKLDHMYAWGDGTAGSYLEGPQKGQILCDFDCATTLEKEDESGEVTRDVSYLLIAHGNGDFDSTPTNTLWCLMLVRTGESDDQFKRVGVARIPRSEQYPEPQWTTRTVKIF